MATISLKNTVDEYFGNSERHLGIGGGGGGGASAAGVAVGAGAAALIGLLTKEEREKLMEEKGKKNGWTNLWEHYYPGVPEPIVPDNTEKEDVLVNPPIIPGVDEENQNESENGPGVTPPFIPDVPGIDEPNPGETVPGETGNEIQDATFDNIETTFDMQSLIEFLEEDRNARWEREDAIRAETQAREDNAYQRAIADMQKAGINPNLMGNITPAAAGGGITNQAGLDMEVLQTELMNQTDILEKMIDIEFKGDENTKDRLLEGISTFGQLLANLAIMKFFKGSSKKTTK